MNTAIRVAILLAFCSLGACRGHARCISAAPGDVSDVTDGTTEAP